MIGKSKSPWLTLKTWKLNIRMIKWKLLMPYRNQRENKTRFQMKIINRKSKIKKTFQEINHPHRLVLFKKDHMIQSKV